MLKALETVPLFKIVCLFLLFFEFCLLFGKNKLFLHISGNASKGYRYSKKRGDFILDLEFKTQIYFCGMPDTTVLLTGT